MEEAREKLIKALDSIQVGIDVDAIESMDGYTNECNIHLKTGRVITKSGLGTGNIPKLFSAYANAKPTRRKRDQEVACEGEFENGRLRLWVSLATKGVNALEIVFDNEETQERPSP